MNITWKEEAIAQHHNRKSFDCGEKELNTFLYRYARQNHTNGGSKTYLAIENSKILGFYTLCPASIDYADTPKVISRDLPRHEIPVFRLGRLAVDKSVQGQGIGGQLLLSAGHRSLLVASQVGGVALLIDAKNKSVAQWYASYGAVPLLNHKLSLLLPLRTIYTALQMAGKIG